MNNLEKKFQKNVKRDEVLNVQNVVENVTTLRIAIYDGL